MSMFDVPDPSWKLDPDIVADESARERYLWDEEASYGDGE